MIACNLRLLFFLCKVSQRMKNSSFWRDDIVIVLYCNKGVFVKPARGNCSTSYMLSPFPKPRSRWFGGGGGGGV